MTGFSDAKHGKVKQFYDIVDGTLTPDDLHTVLEAFELDPTKVRAWLRQMRTLIPTHCYEPDFFGTYRDIHTSSGLVAIKYGSSTTSLSVWDRRRSQIGEISTVHLQTNRWRRVAPGIEGRVHICDRIFTELGVTGRKDHPLHISLREIKR